MGPGDYQTTAPQAGSVGQALPSFQMAQQAPPVDMLKSQQTGQLDVIYARIQELHHRICEHRGTLQDTLDRLGVPHMPQPTEGRTAGGQPPEMPGTVPAIISYLSLLFEAVADLQYNVERARQL